ncbi:MAG: N4-gp56 family major capsid protein [Pirellulales bacterium]
MAQTEFAVNDSMAQKMWTKELIQAERDTADISKLMGESDRSVIQVKMDTAKVRGGDQVTFALRARLTGDGFTEGQTALGNAEAMNTYSDAVVINELGNTVGTKSENTIDAQRVPFDLRASAKDGLADWWADRKTKIVMNHFCGNTVANTTLTGSGGSKYIGFNTVTAPTSGRQIWAGSATNDQGLTSSDTFVLSLIDKAKEAAMLGNNIIRPVMVGGQPKYVMYLDPAQVTSLRTTTTTGGWQDITKYAYSGVDVKSNPLYSGSLGEYNGVILRQSQDVSLGVHSSSGAAVSSTRRAVFLGAQAGVMAYGGAKPGTPSRYRWSEELTDHARRLEVGAWALIGFKKVVFNSADFGCLVVSTYAARVA